MNPNENVEIDDGYNTEGQGTESDEEQLKNLNDVERAEILYERRQRRIELQEKLDLASNEAFTPVSAPSNNQPISEKIKDVHLSISHHLLLLILFPEELAPLLDSVFLPLVVKNSIFYIPSKGVIYKGLDVQLKPSSEAYLFRNRLTNIYLVVTDFMETLSIRLTELEDPTIDPDNNENSETNENPEINRILLDFIENTLAPNNVTILTDEKYIESMVSLRKKYKNGTAPINDRIRKYKIEMLAFKDIENNPLNLPSLNNLLKDIFLISDNDYVKNDNKLEIQVKSKIKEIKTKIAEAKAILESKKEDEKLAEIERLKKRYSQTESNSNLRIEENGKKTKPLKDWLEDYSINTTLSEKNMVRGCITNIKNIQI